MTPDPTTRDDLATIRRDTCRDNAAHYAAIAAEWEPTRDDLLLLWGDPVSIGMAATLLGTALVDARAKTARIEQLAWERRARFWDDDLATEDSQP